jgi:hypothetical protein
MEHGPGREHRQAQSRLQAKHELGPGVSSAGTNASTSELVAQVLAIGEHMLTIILKVISIA